MIFPQDGTRIQVVIPDGLGALVPHGISPAPTIPWASDVTYKFAVVHSDGTPYNLAGCALQISFKQDPADPAALISRLATITNAAGGLGEIVTSSSTTDRDLLLPRSYFMDAAFTSATNVRDEGLLPTRIDISGVVTYPTDLVSSPVFSPPLALGPAGSIPAHLASTAPGLVHSGLAAIDGTVPSAGWTILDKNNATGSLRGLWVASAGAWTRSVNASLTGEIYFGQLVAVIFGTVNGGTIWGVTTADPITPGTTAISYEEVGGSSSALATNTQAGLQPMLAAVSGAVPVDTGANSQTQRRLTLDDIDPAYDFILGTSATDKELGISLVNPAFTATNSVNTASATSNDGSGALAIPTPSLAAYAYNGGVNQLPARSYTGVAVNQTVAFTEIATKVGGSPQKTHVLSLNIGLVRAFFGVRDPGAFDEAWIKLLANNRLQTGYATKYACTGVGSGTSHLYIVLAHNWGVPLVANFKDAATNILFPMTKILTGVPFNNSVPVAVPGGMDIWESDNPINLTTFTIAVS